MSGVEVEVLTAKTMTVTLRDSANAWVVTFAVGSAQAAEIGKALLDGVETQRRLWPELSS